MRSIRAFLLGLCLVAPAGTALSQGTQIAFGGLKQDSSAPVTVTSKTLRVDQEKGTALFTGDVVVVQGQMRMTAPVLHVLYAQAEGDQKGHIQTLHATDGVTLVTSPTEAAEGQDAVYSVDTGVVVMTGNVLLTQGQSVIAGDKLVVNLNTGKGHMEGHVKTTLQPAAKTKATKP